MTLDFWYGTKDHIGLKEQMIKAETENKSKGQEKIMEEPVMTEKNLTRLVNKQRNGKAAGVDGEKAEVMKQLIKNNRIKKALLRAFNCSLEENVNRIWLESKTSMIVKKGKPQYKENRPIAVMVWSSKIVYGFLREKIEDHLENWAYNFVIQYGFTRGGRIEHCLYNLAYIGNRTYESTKKRHRTQYYAMIDFRKAYDSVNRKKLIEVQVKYNVNTKIIDIVV